MRSGFRLGSAAVNASMPVEMGAIGADPADDLDAAVEEERNVAALHRGSYRLGAVDERALVGVGETQQHGGDVGGGEDGVERVRESCGFAQFRRNKIESLARALLGHPRRRPRESGDP